MLCEPRVVLVVRLLRIKLSLLAVKNVINYKPVGRNTEAVCSRVVTLAYQEDVQRDLVHSIKDSRSAEMMRTGVMQLSMIWFLPHQLRATLETRN